MEIIKQLIGRLHPLIVHLPIGFILFGLLLHWHDRKKKEYTKSIPIAFLWGGIAASLACITGYLQYLGEGYAFDTVKWHLWSGIATALFSILMYFKLKKSRALGFLANLPIVVLLIVFFILLSFTGHQGGTITHGEDYLVEPLPNSIKSALGIATFEEKEIVLNDETWEDALIYVDVIKPILNNNCISCHGPKKSKANLVLHTEDGIIQGGENGEIIIFENAEQSELYSRLVLPKNDEDHMPPKDKKQPSKEEIKLIGAWITAGHPFEGTIKEIGFEKNLFLSFFPVKLDNDYPNLEIVAAPQDSIRPIIETGVHVDLITKASNFLKVSCINKPEFSDTDFKTLLPIREQIAVLDLGGTRISDAIFNKLTLLTNLTVLKVDHTSISGKNIELLRSLQHLTSINMTATQFKDEYLEALSDFHTLKKVFLYNTDVNYQGPPTLREGQISIEYGSYELPAIASDSIIY